MGGRRIFCKLAGKLASCGRILPQSSLRHMIAKSIRDCQTVRLIEQIDFTRSSGREQAREQQFKCASR